MDYREELLRTPQILERVMEEKQEAALTRAPLLVFCGCGTSFYLCSQMAGLCGVQGRRALAVEAAELLEDGIRIREQGAFFLFLSRSGASRETVLAQRAAQEAGFSTFYLGCTAGSPLDLACGGSRVIPFAREALVLESYSSTAQLLCLALCCGLKVSPRTPDLARAALEQAEAIYRSALTGMEIRRMICLGRALLPAAFKGIDAEKRGDHSEIQRGLGAAGISSRTPLLGGPGLSGHSGAGSTDPGL